jgi:pyrroline-5-carboxylate reductase
LTSFFFGGFVSGSKNKRRLEAKMLKGKKIGIIGGGKMGSALIGGIISQNLIPADHITVSDALVERLQELKKQYGINITSNNNEALTASDMIILAVKPQNMAEVLEGMSASFHQKQLIISIAAGIPTKFIEGYLGKGAHVVRVMPNTPALIGEGAAALAGGTDATKEDLDMAREIFESVGITVSVKEDLMDAVTGLSGSGPAYVFLIMEALADGGVNLGLSKDVALKLSAQTIMGAAKLFLTGNKHPAELKDMVTSPGGTTIAGLKALEEGKLRATLMAAVEAAALRSRDLGSKK